MKGVFDTKPGSGYDDDLADRYHFPQRYLPLVRQMIDDWIVLRRPRADGGNLAYFATAQVTELDPDRLRPGHWYARLAKFLPFESVVSWQSSGTYFEEALRTIPRAQVGVYMRGRSVRALGAADFIAIVAGGLPAIADLPGQQPEASADISSSQPEERVRTVVASLSNRVVRDATFRRAVCAAYGQRCAVTGFRLTDRNGHPEVQAAHIWAVAGGGPDVVQNGLALSGTAHWLFDRHLIAIADDRRLLIARDHLPADIMRLVEPATRGLHLPDRRSAWPHPAYIARHRHAFEAFRS